MDKRTRYRDFFELQLRFAEAVAETNSTPIAEAVLLYTNFHRRFGLGDAPAVPGPRWQAYARGLERASHRQRLAWTQQTYADAPDEQPAYPNQVFGCFEFYHEEKTGIARIHFYNRDPAGPLSSARSDARRVELKAMFVHLKLHFPEAIRVEGRSWLYGTDAYRRLFPQDYVRSATLIESGNRFQGMSRWGQFLDRQGDVKAPLKQRFLQNITRLNVERLWETFPLPSFHASAPVQAFYDHYGLAATR